jgi:hypothetical protein
VVQVTIGSKISGGSATEYSFYDADTNVVLNEGDLLNYNGEVGRVEEVDDTYCTIRVRTNGKFAQQAGITVLAKRMVEKSVSKARTVTGGGGFVVAITDGSGSFDVNALEAGSVYLVRYYRTDITEASTGKYEAGYTGVLWITSFDTVAKNYCQFNGNLGVSFEDEGRVHILNQGATLLGAEGVLQILKIGG